MIILNFIKSQWLAFVLLFLFIIYSINQQAKLDEYKATKIDFVTKIDSFKLLTAKNKKLLDSLKVADGVVVEKIKIIKQKEYEKIHIIDSLPANELQSYFSERYPE